MKTILIFSLPILLAACATKPVVHVTAASVPGTTLPADSVESVRYAENIKSYSLGRYVDPADPLIMHEEHPIYRVETTAKWNLHPPTSPVLVSSGPITRIRDTAKTTVLQRDELAAELNRQKEITTAVIQNSQAMTHKLGEMASAVQQTKQMAADAVQLQKQIDAANQRLDLLEEQLRKKQGSDRSVTPAVPPQIDQPGW